MKKIYSILALTILILGLSSCVNSAVDELEGLYPEVESLNLGDVLSDGGITEQDGFNLFKVEGNGISFTLTGKNWYLEPGEYVFSTELKNHVLLSTSTLKGKAITKGSVTVSKDGDNYSLSGLVWMGEEAAKVKASGKLSYQFVEIEPNFTYTISPYEDRGYNLTLNNLDGSFAANFLVITSGSVAGSYEITSDADNIHDGQAFIGLDLSILGLGVLGSYFDAEGMRWFIREGTVVISGDESMYSVDVDGMTAINALEQPYPETSISFSNAIMEEPKPLILEGGSFIHKEVTAEGINEHTLSLKDAGGKDAGRIIIDTAPLGGVIGNFEGVSPLEADKLGKYILGLDASAFGMGILGSYLVIDGKQYLISGGQLTIAAAGDTFTITLNEPVVSGLNASSIEISGLVLENEPEQPKEDVVFEVKGGTYTLTSALKPDADGIMEHTFVFKDAEGNVAGQILLWSSDDTYTGLWPYLAPQATPVPGSLVGGMELDLSAFGLGISTLGSYFIKDGKTYLVNAGTAIVAEEDGKLGVLISGVEAATGASSGSEASDVTVISFSEMEAYVAPVVDSFTVEGGTYTISKEEKESIDEHTIQFSDSEGNFVAQVVLRTAKGAELSGNYTVAGADEAAGTYVFGMDFFGMMNIGTYYVKDGVTFYVTGGTLNFVDFFTIFGFTVDDAVSADKDGNAGAVSIGISGMTKAE